MSLETILKAKEFNKNRFASRKSKRDIDKLAGAAFTRWYLREQ